VFRCGLEEASAGAGRLLWSLLLLEKTIRSWLLEVFHMCTSSDWGTGQEQGLPSAVSKALAGAPCSLKFFIDYSSAN
jgi:hypothetical protein